MDGQFLVLSMNDRDPKVRTYKKRRFHTKDRLGCLSCRQKRVKCDQTKPICSRCLRTDRRCQFDRDLKPSWGEHVDVHPSPRPLPPWAGTTAGTSLETVVRGSGYGNGTEATFLLRHATDMMIPVLGGLVDSSMWELVCGHPHLLTSMLAVSASHLAYHATDPSCHRAAERALLSASLESFRPALAQPLTAQRADALVMTSMMLNNLAFSGLETLDPLESWVFDGREDRFNWLALQMGIKPLLMATAPFHHESLLRPMHEASDVEDKTFSNVGGSLGRVPSHWVKLALGMDLQTTPADSDLDETYPFREAMRLLAEICLLPPSPGNLFLFVRLFGALDPRFVRLLRDGDEGAHWLLGYWLGLMSRLNMWWCIRRARRDWTAIREYLVRRGVAQRNGVEGEMWRKLMVDYDTVRPDGAELLCSTTPWLARPVDDKVATRRHIETRS